MTKEWALDRKSRKEKASRLPARHRSNLKTYVDTQRKRHRAQHTPRAKAVVVEHLKRARLHLETLTARYQQREREETCKTIRDLETRLESLESGRELSLFNDTVQPYIDMMQQLEETREQTSTRKTWVRAPVVSAQTNIKKPRAEFEGDVTTYDENSIRDELAARLENTSPPVLMMREDMCSTCNVAMVVMASEAHVGCPVCSRMRPYMQSTSSHIPYGEEVEFASFSYKRQNHFQEWLNAIQAKENTEVSVDVINQVMAYLVVTAGIRDTNHITTPHVRTALKKLKLKKQYDHTMQIYVSITGKKPPRFTPFHEEQLRLMFDAIQAPFKKHKPVDRKNFLSYSYCLHKFCQILGLDEFLPHFHLLKGPEKLMRQDVIFKNICEELNWEFIPSPPVNESDTTTAGSTLVNFCKRCDEASEPRISAHPVPAA